MRVKQNEISCSAACFVFLTGQCGQSFAVVLLLGFRLCQCVVMFIASKSRKKLIVSPEDVGK